MADSKSTRSTQSSSSGNTTAATAAQQTKSDAPGAGVLAQATPPQTTTAELKSAADLGLNIAAAKGVAPGTGVVYIDQPEDRTAVEKVQALAKVADAAASGDQNVTLAEIKQATQYLSTLANLFARSFNVDFLQEASVSDVLNGEAAARGALAPFGEHPHLVDDQVIPPGMTNPTGEILPPNIPHGSVLQKDGSYKTPEGAAV